MEFESMTGTSGIVSINEHLYVVDSKVITVTDSFGFTENINHDFDLIENITASNFYLFGIYKKDTKYGIFSMELNTKTFKVLPIEYTPVNLVFMKSSEILYVIDQTLKMYKYQKTLVLAEVNPLNDKLVLKESLQFMTIGLASVDTTLYYSYENQVYDLKEPIITVKGDILSILSHDGYLYVMYNAIYNYYSIVQYEISTRKMIKEINGGHISGPPIYSCVHNNNIYISASTNNILALNIFNPTKSDGKEDMPKMTYPLFALNKMNHKFLTDEVNIDVEKIKDITNSKVVDTEPAKNSLIRYYIWVFIFLFICTIILLAIFFKENSVLPALLLSILFISLSYLIKNTYTI